MVKKPRCYAAVVIFFTIPLQACAENLQCKPVQSVYGTMLRGHIFQEHNAANIMACSLLCNSDIRCQSINYVKSRHLCELNNRTKEARPEDYVQDADRVYLTRPSERDIDECASGIHNCINGTAICTNTLGSYKCTCKSGYRGDGQNYCIPDECQDYQVLSNADRKVTNSNGPILCDNTLGPAWFRFQGDAGTKMPTSCTLQLRCGTSATGWLNGTHPEKHEGKVTRQVCFHWYSNCCEWSVNIHVQNCSGYYLYYINGTYSGFPCDLRYCGTD
ncbi:PREDICTED: uromodulin-like isoform X4 [Acropora digitifera]|uniref:uromodulin-like isoform X4 n=1 Tax=Acropora digitifera TaxID=70779 RepID=UPI00077A3131|nr:PREDICTED: uromodulin-like isoform X4 [Acropora digitifera]